MTYGSTAHAIEKQGVVLITDLTWRLHLSKLPKICKCEQSWLHGYMDFLRQTKSGTCHVMVFRVARDRLPCTCEAASFFLCVKSRTRKSLWWHLKARAWPNLPFRVRNSSSTIYHGVPDMAKSFAIRKFNSNARMTFSPLYGSYNQFQTSGIQAMRLGFTFWLSLTKIGRDNWENGQKSNVWKDCWGKRKVGFVDHDLETIHETWVSNGEETEVMLFSPSVKWYLCSSSPAYSQLKQIIWAKRMLVQSSNKQGKKGHSDSPSQRQIADSC